MAQELNWMADIKTRPGYSLGSETLFKNSSSEI